MHKRQNERRGNEAGIIPSARTGFMPLELLEGQTEALKRNVIAESSIFVDKAGRMKKLQLRQVKGGFVTNLHSSAPRLLSISDWNFHESEIVAMGDFMGRCAKNHVTGRTFI